MEKNLCMRPEFFSFSIVKSHLWVTRTGLRCGLVVRSDGEHCAHVDYKVTLPVRLTLAHSVPCVRSFVLRVLARAIVRARDRA